MTSFHTPGHKGESFFKDSVWDLDLTELPETDSLYEANSVLLESEKRVSRLFGTDRTLISSGGNTLCIQAMIRLASIETDKFIVGRNIHRSAVGAMALLGIQPQWILESKSENKGLLGKINSQDILSEIEKTKKRCAVYITTPDYYGTLSCVKSIAEKCSAFDTLLLVDNAHGTHLKFLENSLHPIDLGASMSADSAHKTLPVLTSGAWLHIKNKNLVENSKEAMALFGSTSPSYPIMCSLDLCAEYLLKKGNEDFFNLRKKVEKIKEIAKQKGLTVPNGFSDPTRMVLSANSIGYAGKDFAKYLRKCSIEPEFNCENYVVLIASPFNSDKDWSRLESSILSIEEKEEVEFLEKRNTSLPKAKLTLREAIFAKQKKVSVEDSVGEIAGEIVCPCPPGVPVVMPGEIIEEDQKEALKLYGISKIHVVK